MAWKGGGDARKKRLIFTTSCSIFALALRLWRECKKLISYCSTAEIYRITTNCTGYTSSKRCSDYYDTSYATTSRTYYTYSVENTLASIFCALFGEKSRSCVGELMERGLLWLQNAQQDHAADRDEVGEDG